MRHAISDLAVELAQTPRTPGQDPRIELYISCVNELEAMGYNIRGLYESLDIIQKHRKDPEE